MAISQLEEKSLDQLDGSEPARKCLMVEKSSSKTHGTGGIHDLLLGSVPKLLTQHGWASVQRKRRHVTMGPIKVTWQQCLAKLDQVHNMDSHMDDDDPL